MADFVKALLGALLLVAAFGDTESSKPLTMRHLRVLHARYDCEDRVCSQEKAPVCDNTGKVYANDCEWNKERCKQDQEGVTLILKHMVVVDGVSKCVGSTSRASPPMLRAMHARYDCDDRKCSEEKAPVCDGAGTIYDNDCEWNKERCKQDKEGVTLILKHVVVGDDGETKCVGATSRALHGRAGSAHARYDCDDRTCSKDYAPVCDNTGKLYQNDCEWNKERCKQDKEGVTITLEHTVDMKGDVKCLSPMSRAGAALLRTLHARYDCDDRTCSEEEAPVCDQNGQVYHNDCEWNKERCKQDKMGMTLMLKHATNDAGEWKCVGAGRRMTPAAVRAAHARYDCDDRTCSEEEAPVCDQNGQVYHNDCEWNKERCKQDKMGMTLMLKHATNDAGEWKCVGAGRRMTAGAVRAALARYNCDDRTCSKDYAPVCDNTGKLYQNDCEWNKERCKQDKDGVTLNLEHTVDVKGEMKCVPPVRRSAPSVLRAMAARYDCFNRNCSSEYAPVCDQEERIYHNDCEWNKQRCQSAKLGKEVKLYEVMDVGGKIACMKTRRRRRSPPLARMKCSWDCPDSYEPVCDTELQEYKNICYFAKQKCLNNKLELRVQQEGDTHICGKPDPK